MKLNIILLALLIPIGEIHKLWIHSNLDVDCFLFKEYMLNIQWVIKDVGSMAQFSIISFIAYRLSLLIYNIKPFRSILLALFLFSLVDILFYFLNFKTGYYGICYYSLSFIIIIIKYLNPNRNEKTS